ncbi:hypothetical protein ABZ656_10690 [Streptomyces sp. NPDC007095]|jgi:hypothetical protein|uniref:hypothetical protein n=1 Tax=Streptomyces sp. NPDC007095 TaxID=3154482 RepID=UPI000C6FD629
MGEKSRVTPARPVPQHARVTVRVEYAAECHRGSCVSTEDRIAIASEVSGAGPVRLPGATSPT